MRTAANTFISILAALGAIVLVTVACVAWDHDPKDIPKMLDFVVFMIMFLLADKQLNAGPPKKRGQFHTVSDTRCSKCFGKHNPDSPCLQHSEV